MKRLLIPMMLIVGAAIASGEWHFPEKYTGPKTVTTDTSWHPDILEGYEARYVNHGEAFDGPCRSTIIRKICKNSKSRKAYLYIHGFNDFVKWFHLNIGNKANIPGGERFGCEMGVLHF